MDAATPNRIRLLIIQPECHDRSHDPNDLVEQMIAAFPKEKYEITSAFLQGQPSPSHPPSAAEHVAYFDLPDHALKGMRLRLRWQLFRFCRERRFDVAICNRYKPVSLLMQLNRWLNIPVCIGISHGLGEYKGFWRRQLARWNMDQRWRFVGVSSAVTDYLTGLSCGFTAQNTTAISNAIDIAATEQAFLSREAARAELGITPEACIVGSIGRLVRVKGHIFLLQAFARIHERFPQAQLAIIGDGKEEGALRQEITRLGLEDKVLLLGFRKQAARFAQAFDLWVMPSLSEGLPRALLEGMCARLPVISSDIPALKPIVQGAGGLAVPAATVEPLAAALESYLAKPADELRQAGQAAYDYLCQHHSIAGYQASYRGLVEAALAAREGSA